MSAVTIGVLTLTYDEQSGFVGVSLEDEGEPVGSFELDPESWERFRLAAQMDPSERPSEADVIVALTVSQARALGLASIFGGPEKPPEGSANEGPWNDLKEGRRILREGIEAAKGDTGF